MVLPFRFGVNLMSPASRPDWIEKCRRAEDLGFDVLGVPDHLGMPAPFPALMLAAEVTERPRLNTFVLNTPFYNPVLLAREVAGLDQLTGGRFELGLGSGYVRAEFEAAGLPFPSAGSRVAHLEQTVITLRRLFADPDYRPRLAQPDGPPLLIAGWGERALGVAAAHADIVAFTGAGSADSGLLTLATAADTQKKTQQVRGLLGSRSASVEFNLLVQAVATPGERDATLAYLTDHLPFGFAGAPEDLPVILLGTPAQMAEALRERRERFGFNYITVLEHNMERMAGLIELLQGE
ncbi:TIGR03621 family F420-dependent LLM class oxidoreductase [Nocardia yunnanensis]|uniref:TIGR03621 family F420-dependent LLM class oxidoreductase n=1 Tax=Nocardia yunnanensis TaxID=2382165 RepID=A0A386ZG91_9NOCA|nr:TIGR03621 family F420-dependent LLM class oxidoreductase [Nocardia yunnanensis]AYF76466.1 TIGR03621 family F420-dependent LLM class oxidoreductase [Nocardia yunnanensis]